MAEFFKGRRLVYGLILFFITLYAGIRKRPWISM